MANTPYEGKISVTVNDLIQVLQKLSPESIVLIEDYETGNLYDLSGVVTAGLSVLLRFNDDD